MHYKRVVAKIKAHSWKAALGAVLILAVEKLVEHRLLEWANNRIDEGATKLMPYFRDILAASIAHPWWSVFVFLAGYSIVMVAVAHLSAWGDPTEGQHQESSKAASSADSLLQSHLDSAALSDSLELLSPQGIETHIRVSHQTETGIDGLLMSIVNRGERTLDSCRTVVENFRSFDSRRQSFRVESAGNAEVVRFSAVRPDYDSGGYWFVRINKQSEQLEIGNTIGKGVMLWPPKDPALAQKWLLTVRLEGAVRADQGLPQSLSVWRFDVCIEWTRPNILRISNPPR